MKRVILWILFFVWSFRRSTFYRDLADAFRRKVSIRDFLARELDNSRLLKDDLNKRVMTYLSARYAAGNGMTLRDLMAGAVPDSDLMLLNAVDSAKDRVAALETAAEAVDFNIRALKTLARNLAMPAATIPIVAVICVITAEIVVGIGDSAPPEIWSGFNGLVRLLSQLILSYWHVGAFGAAIAVAWVVYVLPRWVGSYRLRADNLPGFSLYRDYNAAVVLSAIAMMIGSGRTLRESLEDMQFTASRWLRWQLRRTIQSLEDNPTDYLAAFGRGLMPRQIRARLASLLDSAEAFDQALIVLGSVEVARLEKRVVSSAVALNWTLTIASASVAVVLSIGQMTIGSAISRAADPAKIMSTTR
jgi:hypothetical protein